jgi:hypothetical protein
MVSVIKQLCIKSYEVEALNGDSWKAKQGKTYTTTVPDSDGEMVTVFSNFWVAVPKEHFVRVEDEAQARVT